MKRMEEIRGTNMMRILSLTPSALLHRSPSQQLTLPATPAACMIAAPAVQRHLLAHPFIVTLKPLTLAVNVDVEERIHLDR